MILKVKSNAPDTKSSWRLYDGVEGLHYSVYESGAKLTEESNKWAVPSDVQLVEHRGEYLADHPMLFCSFSSMSMGPVHLFCDTECYLLNDAGKTIERLI